MTFRIKRKADLYGNNNYMGNIHYYSYNEY